MAITWELARKCIGQAQRHQKVTYNQKGTDVPFRPGERVFLYKPVENTEDNNTATIFRVDRPEQEPLLLVINR
jgi:hypothetical protein